MECKNELDEQREGSESLEGILNQKVTLDTDIRDFFLIAGWRKWHWGSPIYKKASPILQKNIRNYLKSEHSKLNRSEKIRRARFEGSVINRYSDTIQTISDLKKYIESKGANLRGMGYCGLAEFNKTLQKYGIKSIKVDDRLTDKKTS